MARPRLGEEDRRTRTLGVRLTAGEVVALSEQARVARLSMGAYVRRRALGQRVRVAEERRLGTAELRELNRIGVNLNQIARLLNSGAARVPGGWSGRRRATWRRARGSGQRGSWRRRRRPEGS